MSEMQQQLDSVLLGALKPDERLLLSEWSDKYRMLSQKASAEPGRYRTSRTPYLKEIMDNLSVSSPYQEIVVMKGAQIGFSEVGNNWIGYIIDHCPAPTMLVLPSLDMAKRNSKTRLEPMIEETPRLRNAVKEKKSRDSANTMFSKDFAGGVLLITGANSGASLRSAPIKYLSMDEIDGYKQDIDGEGSPIKLATARTRTFARRKILKGSTPTIQGQSQIEREFFDTDQRYYQVPCLGCGFYQKITWPQIKWDDNNPESARFVCSECKFEHENYHKSAMLKRGKWVADCPEKASRTKVGYHISSLYSPHGWYGWPDAVKDFIDAKKSPELLKAFVNTVLGETWSEAGEKPDWRRLYDRRENYEMRVVPIDVCFLTAGCDVQADRVEIEVVGWCERKVSYSIDYHVIMGDTDTAELWRKVTDFTQTKYPLAKNKKLSMGIKMFAIDSGYKTQTVYSWVRAQGNANIIAVKGQENLNTLHGHPKATDVTIKGKSIRRGLKVWPVGVSVAKVELYGWLRQPKPIENEDEPLGFCHFPEYEPEYFKMLTAEKLVTKYVRGYRRQEWVKERERNESLDVRIYARAAASILGMDRFKAEHWSKLKSNVT